MPGRYAAAARSHCNAFNASSRTGCFLSYVVDDLPAGAIVSKPMISLLLPSTGLTISIRSPTRSRA
jgi:hypothetical protein